MPPSCRDHVRSLGMSSHLLYTFSSAARLGQGLRHSLCYPGLATLLVRNVRVPESTNVIACTWFYIFLITPTPICPSAFLCPSWENKMVFLKGKFFPGGQEKERGTFLSPTSRSSRRSAHTGGTSPPNFIKHDNFGAATASLLVFGGF